MLCEGLSIGYLLTSFIAGIITILSPCVLPLLPIIIGSSTANKSLAKALRIIGALAVSVIAFSLLLRVSTELLGVPSIVWRGISGSILILFGVFTFMPGLWDKLISRLGAKQSSHRLLRRGLAKGGLAGDLLVGASLGPVFTSCSPAYLAILGYISAEGSWLVGMSYLLAFVCALCLLLLLIAVFGQKFVAKISVLSNPRGWFYRLLATIFIIVGVLIFVGWDKKIEAYLLEQGLYDWLITLEGKLPGLPTCR